MNQKNKENGHFAKVPVAMTARGIAISFLLSFIGHVPRPTRGQ